MNAPRSPKGTGPKAFSVIFKEIRIGAVGLGKF